MDLSSSRRSGCVDIDRVASLRKSFAAISAMRQKIRDCEAKQREHPKDAAYIDSVIPRQIALFESLHAQQIKDRKRLAGDPIKITLFNGTVKDGKKFVTTPFDMAKELSKGLASIAIVSKVNGVMWDLSRPLEGDCKVGLYTFGDDEGRDILWHSSAHLLGQAIEMEYGCKLCMGSCATRDEGFHYDAFYGDLGLNEDHFEAIEFGAYKAARAKQPFERIEVTRDQALNIFSDNKFKVEIIKDFPVDKTLTVYRCGTLVDLCRGPHIPNTSYVKGFACLKASPVYWRGDKDRELLQRVYGISFTNRKELTEYKHMLKEAKKYDHRELGKNQKLFLIHPLSPGRYTFLPHGVRIYSNLMEFIRNEYKKRGYQEVVTPFSTKLFETSGSAENNRDNMNLFLSEIEKQELGIKPMECARHRLIFNHGFRSYKELPLRLVDFGVLNSNEASGLTGLTSNMIFQQDDVIFCRESQIKDEVKQALDFIYYTCKVFGFNYDLRLSTRPKNYLGDLETWDKAEAALEEVLNESEQACLIDEGDGSFYGPKIDIIISDAFKRKIKCATLQLDFELPFLVKLSYSAEDEANKERPVMIHGAFLGSVERMVPILLEHYKGKWPFWLSPRQAIVCSVSENAKSYALKVGKQIHEAGFYVDVDSSDKRIEEKVQEAQLVQYNYVLVVGEEEEKTGQVCVHAEDNELSVKSIDDLLKSFNEEAKDLK